MSKKKKYGDFLEHYFTNNPNLKSELRTIIYKTRGHEFTFYSDNGVFSKDKIDYGSNLLLDTLFTYKKLNDGEPKKALDVGCGYGLIGISVAKILDFEVTMCDVNDRALHLAQKNAQLNKANVQIINSDTYKNIDGKFDLIITNPPIRAGKSVVYKILDDAQKYLSDDGELWCVIRKNQGAKSTKEHLENYYDCEIVTKNKGFYIIKAQKKAKKS